MTKTKKEELPAEVWLMVATDALSRWAQAGGQIVLADIKDGTTTIATDGRPALWLGLVGISSDDPRLSATFATAIMAAQPAEETQP